LSLSVTHVLPSLTVGGAETFAVQLAEHQLNAGLDVHLLCLTAGGPLYDRLSPELSARTRVIGKRWRYDARVLPRAAAQLRRWAPEVVHTHLFTGLAWGGVATRLAGRAAWVHTQHAAHPEERPLVRALERRLYAQVDGHVACSPSAARFLEEGGYTSGPVQVIENGIPLAGRRRAALAGAPPIIGTVGRLTAIKGQGALIQAIALLRDRGADLRLVIMGGGELEADHRALIERLNLQDRVTLTGPVSDVAERLADLDLFVLPSLSEALPLALLEACAAGLPVLVTSKGGARIVVEQGAGGWTVDPGDAAVLAEALARFVALNREQRLELGAASRRVVEERYALGVCAERYLVAYRAARSAR